MNEPLMLLSSKAIVLREMNVDTDIIFPARFLLKMEREGMADCLFRDRRFAADGTENIEHPFNQPKLRDVKILIAGSGFGCGSSREQAVWALVDWGLRVVIAPTFGDIFAGNAQKNGLLCIRLDSSRCDHLAAQALEGQTFSVDIPARTLSAGAKEIVQLDLGDIAAQAFMEGWDEIDVILNQEMKVIRRFEKEHRTRQPWLFDKG